MTLRKTGRRLQKSDHRTFEFGDVLLQNGEVLGDARDSV